MSITLRSKGRILCFSSSYASHSGHDVQMNISFYQEAQSYVRKSKGAHFLGRDFNARLHHRYQPEESALGPHIYRYVWQGAWLPRASRRLHPRKPIPVSELLFTGWPQRIEHMLQKNTREVLHLSGKYNWTWPRMDSSEVCVEIVLTWLLELTSFSFPTITVYSWSLRSCQVAASQAPQTKST